MFCSNADFTKADESEQMFCSNADFKKADESEQNFVHVHEFAWRHNLLSRTSENSKCFPHSLGIRDIEVCLYLIFCYFMVKQNFCQFHFLLLHEVWSDSDMSR